MKLSPLTPLVTVTFVIILTAGAVDRARASAATLSGIVAHRAVYDVELLESSDRSGIRAMNGRIVYEINGSVCEGFAVSFRFVTRIETGRKSYVTDQRTTTYEDSAGKKLRFVTRSYVNDQFEREVRGNATRTDEGTNVNLTKPESRTIKLGKAIFMTEHLGLVIEKAENGETFFAADVFDGSDSGDELMATTTIIGKKSTFDPVEKSVGTALLEGKTTWPVSISYFSLNEKQRGESLPVYQVSFDLFKNGISGNLKMIYKDYSLKAKLNSVELLPMSSCEK